MERINQYELFQRGETLQQIKGLDGELDGGELDHRHGARNEGGVGHVGAVFLPSRVRVVGRSVAAVQQLMTDKPPPKPDDTESDADIQRRFEETLGRLVNTPHKPHQTKTPPGKPRGVRSK